MEAMRVEKGYDNFKKAICFCHPRQRIDDTDVEVMMRSGGIPMWDSNFNCATKAEVGDYIIREFLPLSGTYSGYKVPADIFEREFTEVKDE